MVFNSAALFSDKFGSFHFRRYQYDLHRKELGYSLEISNSINLTGTFFF
jgi:hypothetical protein